MDVCVDLRLPLCKLHAALHDISNNVDTWYPGKDECDIATLDHGVREQWQLLYELTSGKRVLALAEVGVIPDPGLQEKTGTQWAY